MLHDTRAADHCERLLEVPDDLECLAGHFPRFPVVPGVAQVGWVLDAAREILGATPAVQSIEALKFKRLLRPADVVRLRVDVSRDRSAVDFRLMHDASLVASGRLRLAQPRIRACALIPIFDHGDTIGDVLAALAPLGLPCIVVNDGSGRETSDALTGLAERLPWVTVEHLRVNRGRGAALQHGYRVARARGFSHAVQLDADGQHDPADAPALLEAAERHPDALVLGAPRFDGSAPRVRLYGRRLSQVIVWAYTGSRAIEDPLCGFRCFPLEPTVALLERERLGSRMDFDPEIVVRLAWLGVPVVNVPVRVRYFAGGRSHFRMVRDNARIVRTYARLLGARVTRGWGGERRRSSSHDRGQT